MGVFDHCLITGVDPNRKLSTSAFGHRDLTKPWTEQDAAKM